MKNIKEIASFGLSLHAAYAAADADGKIDFKDTPLLMGPLMKLLPAIEDAKLAKDELMAMKEEDRKAMMVELSAEYDIPNDELEKKVEDGMDVALHIAQYVGALS